MFRNERKLSKLAEIEKTHAQGEIDETYIRDEIVEIMFERYRGPSAKMKECVRELDKIYREKRESVEKFEASIDRVLQKYEESYRGQIGEALRSFIES